MRTLVCLSSFLENRIELRSHSNPHLIRAKRPPRNEQIGVTGVNHNNGVELQIGNVANQSTRDLGWYKGIVHGFMRLLLFLPIIA